MAALPYVKLFPGDYFADTRHLSCLEHGAYLQLIMTYWSRGGPLPNDDTFLARVVGLGPREWRRIKPRILSFFEVQNTLLAHKRLESEIAAATAKSLNNKRPGNANAKRTRPERPQHHSHSHSHSLSSSASPTKKDTPQTPQGGAERDLLEGVAPSAHSPEPDNGIEPGERYSAAFEDWWGEYPNKTGKGAAAKSYSRAVKRLANGSGTAKVDAMLMVAIRAQKEVWRRRGVFGKFIPHPATWLNQSRWSDEAVITEIRREETMPKPTLAEVSAATPPPERKAKPQPVGWIPSDGPQR